MYDMGLDRPNLRCSYYLFMHHVRYVLRPEIVIKVVFGFVGKHAVRHR